MAAVMNWCRLKIGRILPVAAGFVLATGIVLLLWKVPQWQASRATDIESLSDRIALENELRRTMATVIAGALVLWTGYLTWRNVAIAQQNLGVSQQGQITERFTKAIEQLGASHDDGRRHLEIRLGGIYALERIARDSLRDHGPIMEVLTACVRENASLPSLKVAPSELAAADQPSSRVPADVQAILTVIGRRTEAQRQSETSPLDLANTSLQEANLFRAHLAGANLFEADLAGAGLRKADLAPGQTLYTARFVFQPDSEIFAHGHPGTTSLTVESGTFGWTLLEGTAHVIRGAASGEPTGTEELTEPGTEVTLERGDAIYYEDDVVHTARGAGDEPTVILASMLLETGEPLLHEAEEATPAS